MASSRYTSLKVFTKSRGLPCYLKKHSLSLSGLDLIIITECYKKFGEDETCVHMYT